MNDWNDMAQRCSAKNSKGKPCGAWAVTGKSKCALHLDPERAAKLGANHGRKALAPIQSGTETLSELSDVPKTAKQVCDVLAETLIQVRSKRLDARTASTVAYVATSLLNAIKVSDFETRLARIEQLFDWEQPNGNP